MNPPAIRVASYAMVDSHILLSMQLDNVTSPDKVARKYRKYMGTYGYDMEKKVWEMVHEMNLPYLGQAVPLGDQLFLARSKERDGAYAVYYMHVGQSTSGTSELSIIEVPLVVPKARPILGELLVPLGRGRFSSVHFRSVDAEPESKFSKPSDVHGTYSIVKENFDDAIIMKQQWQV